MTQKQFIQELNSLDMQQLREKLEYSRKEYFTTRLSARNERVKDISQFKRLRKNIARILTLLHEKNKRGEQ